MPIFATFLLPLSHSGPSLLMFLSPSMWAADALFLCGSWASCLVCFYYVPISSDIWCNVEILL